MNKVVKVSLNTDEINDVIKKLNTLKNDIKDLPNKLVNEISKDALTYLDMEYANTPYNDNVDNIETRKEKSENGYKIIAEGKDVIYAEFGTGDEGENNPYPDPEKAEYNLNDYNSGETIRDVSLLSKEKQDKHNIKSGKYWTYEKNGVIYYTQGIPAGKQMFNTRNYVINEGIEKARKKLVGDVLSKL